MKKKDKEYKIDSLYFKEKKEMTKFNIDDYCKNIHLLSMINGNNHYYEDDEDDNNKEDLWKLQDNSLNPCSGDNEFKYQYTHSTQPQFTICATSNKKEDKPYGILFIRQNPLGIVSNLNNGWNIKKNNMDKYCEYINEKNDQLKSWANDQKTSKTERKKLSRQFRQSPKRSSRRSSRQSPKQSPRRSSRQSSNRIRSKRDTEVDNQSQDQE